MHEGKEGFLALKRFVQALAQGPRGAEDRGEPELHEGLQGQRRWRSVIRTVAKTVWQRAVVMSVHNSSRMRPRSSSTGAERDRALVPSCVRRSMGPQYSRSF
jgi:hypothetical protein